MLSKKLKVQIKLVLRYFKDTLTNQHFLFVKKQMDDFDFKFSRTLVQEIKPSETYNNKVFNIGIAAENINQYVIKPNEVFSFWKIIGNPNKHYKKGRSIVRGKLVEEIGGGLCQVSGIIYHLSILTGLKIIERFNHSMDIYTDETRFTPLGTDATVVYGFKDLRIKNNLTFPIKFQMEIEDNKLILKLLSASNIDIHKLFFETTLSNNCKIVEVRNDENKLVNKSSYNLI